MMTIDDASDDDASDDDADDTLRLTQSIETYRICSGLECDFHSIGTYHYLVEGNSFTVEVVIKIIIIITLKLSPYSSYSQSSSSYLDCVIIQ